MMFDTQNRRMAMAASPAPRKMALLRNSMTMAPQPPSAMRAYPEPVATMAGDAPISCSSFGAKIPAGTPSISEIASPSTMA